MLANNKAETKNKQKIINIACFDYKEGGKTSSLFPYVHQKRNQQSHARCSEYKRPCHWIGINVYKREHPTYNSCTVQCRDFGKSSPMLEAGFQQLSNPKLPNPATMDKTGSSWRPCRSTRQLPAGMPRIQPNQSKRRDTMAQKTNQTIRLNGFCRRLSERSDILPAKRPFGCRKTRSSR